MQDDHPIAYTSSKFIPAEINYTTGEQELLAVFKALRVWRCYLEGTKSTLITDHNPLTHLQEQPSLSRRQACWMEYLARFDYDWKYRPGRLNVADPISRNPTLGLVFVSFAATTRAATKALLKEKNRKVPLVTPRTRGNKVPVVRSFYDRVLEGYALDPWFADLANTGRLTLSPEGFWLRDGLICVPDVDTLRTDIIREHHAPPLAGHVGTTKTSRALLRTFWWPKLRLDVGDFITKCHQCQVNKPTNQKSAGLLHPLPIPEANWDSISTDLITKLPKTNSGYDAILVWVCRLSKMVHICPTTTEVSAKGWAECFTREVVRLHGLPKSIVSDRDPRFTSTFWSEVCTLLGIKQNMSTSFHPQTDGQTERANRTLEDMLRSYISPRQTDWDEHLTAVEFAINNSWHESTRDTPFYLNYGQHPLTPINLSNGPPQVPAATAFVNRMQTRIAHAKLCLKQAQDRQASQANVHRRSVSFSVSKLVGTVAVKLDLPWTIHPVFHVSLIKPYHANRPTA